MTHHTFNPSTYYQTIGSHAAALAIADGDTITVSTLDANGYDLNNEHKAADPNPMSGPFFIEGAAPGDALAVEIIKIAMTRATGWTRQGLAWHVVDPHGCAKCRRVKRFSGTSIQGRKVSRCRSRRPA